MLSLSNSEGKLVSGYHLVPAPSWILLSMKRLCSSLEHSPCFFVTVKPGSWFGRHPASKSSKSLLTIFQVVLFLFQFQHLTLATSLCPLKLIWVICLTFWTICSPKQCNSYHKIYSTMGRQANYLMNLPFSLLSTSILYWDCLFKNLLQPISDSTAFSLVRQFSHWTSLSPERKHTLSAGTWASDRMKRGCK